MATLTDTERLSILNSAILSYAAKGYVLSYKDESAVTAVLKKKETINNTLHIVLSLITCGFWLTIWLIMALVNTNKEKAVTLSVSPTGQISQF